MAIQRITSKLAKTNVLLKHEMLREYIPSTRKWSRESLNAMLSQYGMVYVKPNSGTYGKGVIRVESSEEDGYTFQIGTRIRQFDSLDDLYEGLLKEKLAGPYVIQRGIHLLKHRDRRFDIRVMVQRNPKGKWETTGIIGRLAHPDKIVTNYHSGGKLMDFQCLMSSHMSETDQKAYTERLKMLGLTVARQLQTQYPGLKELGLDVAIDTAFYPWILEVNSCPDPFIFRKLKDPHIFRRIYRYAVAYGRFKSKRK